MAKIDIKGREANIAAMGVNRFPSSETTAMMKPDTTILIRYCMGYL
jgi:hypothetical protein